jgi:hypothetical protein
VLRPTHLQSGIEVFWGRTRAENSTSYTLAH